MKKKILVFMLLFAFLVGVLVPAQDAKADTSEDIKRYSDVNECIDSLGLNLPNIELKDGYFYLFYSTSSYYIIKEFNPNTYLYKHDNCLNSGGSTTCSTYILRFGNLDYSNYESWILERDNVTEVFDVVCNNIYYSDVNIYVTNSYSSVYFYRNNFLDNIPDINNFIDEDEYETVICGRYSVMRKADADKPFLLVGSGTPILRTTDRAIAFMSDSGGYTEDMELYLVDDTGNWYLANENLSSFGATDITGYGVEFAPSITYTNRDIYFQDDTVTDVTPSSEIWVSYVDFIEPYTFEQWCSDAGLTCAASSNETEDLYDFSFNSEDNHYIIRRNRISGSEYTWYLSQVTKEEDLIYYATNRALADSSIGAAALYVLSGEYASGSTKVCNYVYDSSGGGWLFIDNNTVDLGLTNEYYVDDIGITYSSSMPIVYSSTDIYTDKEQSSVYYAANTEYEDSEVTYPDISPTSTPTPTPISNSGSTDLGGNVIAGGGIDFIISLVSSLWNRVYSIPMYVDGFQITLQQLYVYGILAGIVGAAIFAFTRRK